MIVVGRGHYDGVEIPILLLEHDAPVVIPLRLAVFFGHLQGREAATQVFLSPVHVTDRDDVLAQVIEFPDVE